MAHSIFIVEDDPVICQLLEQHLTQWGFECRSVQNFQKVLAEIGNFEAELVILDISLPYYNGFYWCQKIRETSQVPIIFLSSADDQMNMVMAMNMGADDFIAKPFDLHVLVAKVQALLRRSYDFTQPSVTELTYHSYTFSPQENRVAYQNTQVDLSPNESKIMLLLFKNAGNVVPRETIMELLWEGDEFVDSNTLAVNMTRLRKKLSVIGLDHQIQTIKNTGYMLKEVTK